METDRETYYRVLCTRDKRFDGKFFTGVLTTGIFCRPICPARTPKKQNCQFYPTAAAAMAAGLRPCLRCRPEAAPGSPAWNGVATTVARALKLIDDGVLDDMGIHGLAERLGVSTRHLRRLFAQHLGASPSSVASSQRILLAKKLISETNLPLSQIAIHSGFNSVRRFNDAIKKTYQRTPSQLRRNALSAPNEIDSINIKLAYRPPYDWNQVSGFLQTRAIPGVEEVGPWGYRRSIRLGGKPSIVEAIPDIASDQLKVKFTFNDVGSLQSAVNKIRALFDLDVDCEPIHQQFSTDPVLAKLVKKNPGLRVPGAWDVFELSVRAILGQQISVAAASTFAGRLVKKFGHPLKFSAHTSITHLFPLPEELANEDLTVIGLPRKRAESITGLARGFPNTMIKIDSAKNLEEVEQVLCQLPGVGPWTAQYIAMRALGYPDAFPVGDLGLIRSLKALNPKADSNALSKHAERWRPWRAYAAMHLWTGAT
jgi:AraC family transcriptional regulator of adaptative response / DNA-3-methyladenine glycosylase II